MTILPKRRVRIQGQSHQPPTAGATHPGHVSAEPLAAHIPPQAPPPPPVLLPPLSDPSHSHSGPLNLQPSSFTSSFGGSTSTHGSASSASNPFPTRGSEHGFPAYNPYSFYRERERERGDTSSESSTASSSSNASGSSAEAERRLAADPLAPNASFVYPASNAASSSQVTAPVGSARRKHKGSKDVAEATLGNPKELKHSQLRLNRTSLSNPLSSSAASALPSEPLPPPTTVPKAARDAVSSARSSAHVGGSCSSASSCVPLSTSASANAPSSESASASFAEHSAPLDVTTAGPRGPRVSSVDSAADCTAVSEQRRRRSSNEYNSEDEYTEPCAFDAETEHRFSEEVRRRGLEIKPMQTDGACLFRSIAEQIYGSEEFHDMIRQKCCDYMLQNRDYFSAYVTEPFDQYITRKRRRDCHGNHTEMQAMAELYNRLIEVYEFKEKALRKVEIGASATKLLDAPLRVSYHRRCHFNAVIDPRDRTVGLGLGLPDLYPGKAAMREKELALLEQAMRDSRATAAGGERAELEATMLADKQRETAEEFEREQRAVEDRVALESYLDFLRSVQSRPGEREPDASKSRRRTNDTCASISSSKQSSSSCSRPFGSPRSPPPLPVEQCAPPVSRRSECPQQSGRKPHHSGSSVSKPPHPTDEASAPPHSSASSALRPPASGASPDASAASSSSAVCSPIATTGAPPSFGSGSSSGGGSSSLTAPRSSPREHGSPLLSDLQILNEIPPELLGLSELSSMELGAWGPEAGGVPDLALASALLQSQRDYLEQLGRHRPSDSASNASMASTDEHRN